jgi:hypothetical protein
MFRRILEFIYGGAVQIDEKNALPMMELAHKYSITNLEEACSSFLGKTLDVDNVLPVYTVALALQRKDLSDVSINFVRSKAKEVFASATFLDITEELLCAVMADDELAMDELEIFEAALRWGKHRADSNSEPLESAMSSVVQVIRFPLIGASKLINRVKPTGVVPIELYVEALEFSASPRTAPMDGARFRKRKAPKMLATAGAIMSPSVSSVTTRNDDDNNSNSSMPSTPLSDQDSVRSGSTQRRRTPAAAAANNTPSSNASSRPSFSGRNEDLEEDSKLSAAEQPVAAAATAAASSSTPNRPELSLSNTSSSSSSNNGVPMMMANGHSAGNSSTGSAPATPTGSATTSTVSIRSKTPKGARGATTTAAVSGGASSSVGTVIANISNGAPASIPSNAVEFKYERDFDESGVFYYIATNARNGDWENPATSGKVLVTSSVSFDWGSASNLLARKNFNTWTASQPGVWVSLSMRGFAVLPTHYTLRHGYVSDGANLRNWVFEGSSDGNTWIILSTHTNDRSLGGNYGTASWKIDGARDFFSHFRIRSTGRDGGNSDRIQLCGVELYGYLTEKH